MNKQITYLTDNNREIYLNLKDVLFAIKDIIAGARADGLDPTVGEILFVFLGEKHEEIETRLKEQLAAKLNQQRPELEKKYQHILNRIDPKTSEAGISAEVVSDSVVADSSQEK